MILLRYLIFFTSLKIVINLLRVTAIGREYLDIFDLAMIVKIGIITFFLLALVSIIQNRKEKRTIVQGNIGKIIFLFVGFNIIATIVGLYNGFEDKLIQDFFNSISGLTVAYAVAGLNLCKIQITRFLKEFSICITALFIMSFVFIEIRIMSGYYPYLALVPGGLAISFFYFGSPKKYGLLGKILTIILFIISLKRSLILSFIFSLMLFFSLKKVKNIFSVLTISTSGLLLCVLILFGLAKVVEGKKIPLLTNTFTKVNQVNPWSESSDFWLDSGGARISESISAFNSFKEANHSWLLGAGNGFIYQENAEVFPRQRKTHNVHITPIGILLRYGILMSSVIFFIFFKYIMWILKLSKNKNEEILEPFLFYQLFGFTAALFSFSIAIDFILWTSMGLVCLLTNKVLEAEVKTLPEAMNLS